MAEATATTDRNALRTDIETVRSEYIALLDSLSANDWKKKTANPAWTVGNLMWHLGFGAEFFGQAVGYCRKGKAPNPPQFLVNPLNSLLTRFRSRGATPESVRAQYDKATDTLLAMLDGVKDDEWQKAATIYGTDYTIEKACRGPRAHWDEHKADILQGLGRS